LFFFVHLIPSFAGFCQIARDSCIFSTLKMHRIQLPEVVEVITLRIVVII